MFHSIREHPDLPLDFYPGWPRQVPSLDKVCQGYQIVIKLNPEARERFSKLNSTSIGRPLAVLFDEEMVSAPIIKETVQEDGLIVISGNFEREEALRIAREIGGKNLED